jgi:oligopeptide/dipeptide ABC transporter ATP-binding protein
MSSPLLELHHLSKVFPLRHGEALVAVDDVSIQLAAGEVLGVVGESGCGKSTLARLIARLLPASSGSIRFDGHDIGGMDVAQFSKSPLRRLVQMVFQDPNESLNPRFTAFQAIADAVRRLGTRQERQAVQDLVQRAAERAGFPPELLHRYPHQLSGGQKARVDIARAIVLQPKLVILDEPTSALDVSVQAHVIQTLVQLRREMGLSYIFVSHDLNLVRLISDRIVVMYLGRIVEEGTSRSLFQQPRHHYTAALLSAIPSLARRRDRRKAHLDGELGSPIESRRGGCVFAPRCPAVSGRCKSETPDLDATASHSAACFFPLAGRRSGEQADNREHLGAVAMFRS